jgi:hypothetical protein
MADRRPLVPWKSWQLWRRHASKASFITRDHRTIRAFDRYSPVRVGDRAPQPPNDPRIPGPGVSLGVGAYLLRDAVLRTAPQDEARGLIQSPPI